MQQRYYDPLIGRFIDSDPVGTKGAANFNRFWYGASNPYRFVDPDGRYVCSRTKTTETQCADFKKGVERIRQAAMATGHGRFLSNCPETNREYSSTFRRVPTPNARVQKMMLSAAKDWSQHIVVKRRFVGRVVKNKGSGWILLVDDVLDFEELRALAFLKKSSARSLAASQFL